MNTPDRPRIEELLRQLSAREDHGVDLDPEQLERYLHGECSAEEASVVRQQMARSPALRDVALQLAGESASDPERHRFDTVDAGWLARQKQAVGKQLEPSARPWSETLRRWLWSPVMGYGIAALLAILVLWPQPSPGPSKGAAYSYDLRPSTAEEMLRSGQAESESTALEISASVSLFCPTVWIPESVDPDSVQDLLVRVGGREAWRDSAQELLHTDAGSPSATFCVPVGTGDQRLEIEGRGSDGSVLFVSRLLLRRTP